MANSRNQFIKESFIDSQSTTMHDRTTKEATQNITTTFVTWKGPITDGKGKGADMVSDDLEAHIVVIWIIGFTRNLFNFTNNRHKEVCFKVGFCPLKDRRKAFQTSARINILIW